MTSRNASHQLRPVSIPRDATRLLGFNPAVTKEITEIMTAARRDGRWTHPVDMRIDLADRNFWAYWISKSVNPVESAQAGSELEQHFQRHSGHSFQLSQAADIEGSTTTLSFVGDLMGTPGLLASRDIVYSRVEDLIFDADLTFGNLESTLTTQALEPLAFRLEDAPSINISSRDYEALTTHKGRRFDVLQLANNHILDHGYEGISTTLARLDKDGIAQVGVNPPGQQSAHSPQITEVAGIRIGWVAHTFSVNFKPFPNGFPRVVNMTPFHLEQSPDLACIKQQIAECRELNCEFVIVSLHWGLEFEMFPHPDQLSWSREFANAGADLVIGHHPHVMQPVEIYTSVDGLNRQVPIIYSLGNLTPVFSHPATVCSLVARVTIGGTPSARRIRDVELVPVALVESGELDHPQLQLWPLEALLKQKGAFADADYVQAMARYTDIALGTEWRCRG